MARNTRLAKPYSLVMALTVAHDVIAQHGYLPKKAEDLPSKISTATRMQAELDEHYGKNPSHWPWDGVHLTAAQEAIDWLDNLDPGNNDFLHSLKNLLSGGVRQTPGSDESVSMPTRWDRWLAAVRPEKRTHTARDHQEYMQITKSDMGFVASVYKQMSREEEKTDYQEEQIIANKDKEFIGKEGERGEFFVKLVNSRYISSRDFTVYNIVDQKGNLGVIFGNELADADGRVVVVGDCFLARMTPKRHQISEYHRGKETQFNRVKILQNVGSVATENKE